MKLPNPGQVVADRYRLERVLGAGGMALVFEATNITTGESCAVKMVHPDHLSDQSFADDFLREAELASHIGPHRNIVAVRDAAIDPTSGVPFIAMELLTGGDLKQHLRKKGKLDHAEIVLLMHQLAGALDHAHRAGVVHRDLKPANLFINRNENGEWALRVLDFGISKILSNTQQVTATAVGTPGYAAPEQFGEGLRRMAERSGVTLARSVSRATDVWAVAMIAYELLTGCNPLEYWQCKTMADLFFAMSTPERTPPSASAQVPNGFDEWFLRHTALDAGQRPDDAVEAIRQLCDLLESPALLGDTRPLGPLQPVTQPLDAPPAAATHPPDRLIMTLGPQPGSELALSGARLMVGRGPQAQLRLDDDSVSPVHAELVRLGDGRWSITDWGSATGIRVNGISLQRGALGPGDSLEIGDVRLRLIGAHQPLTTSAQLLTANTPMAAATTAGPSSGGGRGRVGVIVAVAAVVAGLLVGVVVLVASGGGDPAQETSTAASATSEAEARKLLDQAKALYKDDVMAAHKLLMRIPESSPLRESEDFRTIEDAWADAMFEKAEQTKDVHEKLEILYAIADATTVSTEKRRKALEMADALDPDPKRPRPRIQPPPAPLPKPVVRPLPPPPAPSPDPTRPPPVKFDEDAQKRALYNKALQGRASETELRMLKGICMNDGDRACRALAVQRMKELKNKE